MRHSHNIVATLRHQRKSIVRGERVTRSQSNLTIIKYSVPDCQGHKHNGAGPLMIITPSKTNKESVTRVLRILFYSKNHVKGRFKKITKIQC